MPQFNELERDHVWFHNSSGLATCF